MIDISKISELYDARILTDSDIDMVFSICQRNEIFNYYCRVEPTKEVLLDDMNTFPTGSDEKNKYYIGFFQEHTLIAIMDIIDKWPKTDSCYLRFFMVDNDYQGKDIGTSIIQSFFNYLRCVGRTKVVFAVVADNPQARHFWEKNGCSCVDTIEEDGLTAVIAEKNLESCIDSHCLEVGLRDEKNYKTTEEANIINI